MSQLAASSPPRSAPVDPRFVKLMVLVNAGVPLAVLAYDYINHRLGPDPTAYVRDTTGLLTLIFLILTLAVTPLRKLTGANWLFHSRRLFGLYAFFCSLVHVAIYILLQKGAKLGEAITEIFNTKYLVIGLIAVIAMLPLAVTSTAGMIRRLGPKRWHRLHRLVYLAGALGAIHYLMVHKRNGVQEISFAIVIALLLLYRPVAFFLNRAKPKDKPATMAGGAGGGNRWRGKLRVQNITRETPNVQTFHLVSADGAGVPFAYKPGQYLTLTLTINHKPVYRSYTIASSPTRPGNCQLTIKRESMGLGSRHLHDTLKIGDTLEVAAPSGEFTFAPDSATSVVLLAAGVGITPLMSILRALVDTNWPGDIHLFYANKTAADIIFKNELAELASRTKNLHITHTLTREESPTWQGRRGRIDAALLYSLPNLTARLYFICGPADMLHATRDLLLSLHIPPENIRMESFGVSAAPSNSGAPVKTFSVTFKRAAVTAAVTSDTPLLEAAEAEKIPADFECRSGICGRCKCPLLAGTVSMATEDALTPADKKANIILLCQSRPASDLTLDL